jgi:hypothetical protein
MQVKWKKLLAKAAVWLTAEILLNILGIDNLADYGEFIFEKDLVSQSKLILIIGALELVNPVNQDSDFNNTNFNTKSTNWKSTKNKLPKVSSTKIYIRQTIVSKISFPEIINIYRGKELQKYQEILLIRANNISWYFSLGIYFCLLWIYHLFTSSFETLYWH